jgi:glycosyltransferase involved in cell wall biosynthesis
LQRIRKHTKCDYQLIIVDDDSDVIYCDADYRFETRAGIPASKNKCLELAEYDHIFLFDDDTYPIADNWYLPYVNSIKEHLCYTFLQAYKVKEGFAYHKLGNGCMMYVTRKCIETIGGFDWRFGLGKYEHVNFSRRIHNACLTESVFMDVVGSDKLLYCMDQKKEVKRSFTHNEMSVLLNNGAKHHRINLKSTEYISYELQSKEHKVSRA